MSRLVTAREDGAPGQGRDRLPNQKDFCASLRGRSALLLVGLFLFCGLMPTAHSASRLIQYGESTAKLNGGRTFYVVVKTTTETEFLVTDYESISQLVSASKPDKSVLKIDLFWPGKSDTLTFDAPPAQTVGVYLMLTNPRSEWKVLLPAPLRHQYRLDISGFSGGTTKPGGVNPANLTISPMPYATALTQRPLTLFAGMIQAEAAVSFYHYQTPLPSEFLSVRGRQTDIVKPARFTHTSLGQIWLRGQYGLSNSFQLGLSWLAGSYDVIGMNIGTVFAPHMRAALSKNMAFDLSLPMDVSPFSMGATVGLPYRIRMGQNNALTLFEDFFSFCLYSRFMDTRYANRVDAANGEFRLLARFQRDLNGRLALEAKSGIEANAYQLGSPVAPAGARLVFLSPAALDVSVGGGVFDVLAEQVDYRFDLRIGLRLGGD